MWAIFENGEIFVLTTIPERVRFPGGSQSKNHLNNSLWSDKVSRIL